MVRRGGGYLEILGNKQKRYDSLRLFGLNALPIYRRAFNVLNKSDEYRRVIRAKYKSKCSGSVVENCSRTNRRVYSVRIVRRPLQKNVRI